MLENESVCAASIFCLLLVLGCNTNYTDDRIAEDTTSSNIDPKEELITLLEMNNTPLTYSVEYSYSYQRYNNDRTNVRSQIDNGKVVFLKATFSSQGGMAGEDQYDCTQTLDIDNDVDDCICIYRKWTNGTEWKDFNETCKDDDKIKIHGFENSWRFNLFTIDKLKQKMLTEIANGYYWRNVTKSSDRCYKGVTINEEVCFTDGVLRDFRKSIEGRNTEKITWKSYNIN